MPSINQLPEELLVKILDYNDSAVHLAQCRLVCQRWNLLAEALMFGKDIVLTSAEGSLSFYSHLYRKPHYGHLVKRLTCERPATQPDILEQILRLAFTTTMEEMNAVIGHGDSFFTLMEAIITLQYDPDQFSKLAAIPHPRYHSNAYNNVLMKLNNTLQRIVIKLDGSAGNRGMRPLFDRLSTFKCLTSITIQGLLDGFAMLETILNGCSLLQQVSVSIHLQENIRTKNDMMAWMAANVRIAHNNNSIQSLAITENYRADLLEFFVYKYPSMKSIVIEGEHAIPNFRENLRRTFTAIKQIPSRKVKLILEEGDLSLALKQLLPVGLQFTLKEENEDQFWIEINSSSSS